MKMWFFLLFATYRLCTFENPAEFRSLEKETEYVRLEARGEIPCWLQGTYVRNGPSKFQVGDATVSHWFDGLAMLHAFHFKNGSCTYSNRFLETNHYQYMMQGYLPSEGFSRTSSLPFEALEGEFYPNRPNAVVNVAQLNQTTVALTEVPTPVTFELNSLNTLGIFDYDDALPKKHCYSTAHLHERDEKVYGYLVEIGPESRYLFYELQENTRKELCSIPLSDPAYVHSFSITDHYILFVDYPIRLDFSALMNGAGFIQSFNWNENGECRFYVIERETGTLLKTLKSAPFFSFHHINAFEANGQVVLDLIGYSDANAIFGKGDVDLGWRRFVIDDKVACIQKIPMEAELPRIHYEKHNGKPYRYFYATCFRKNILCSDAPPLYKVDTEKQSLQTWSLPGYFASEPVFIPEPDGQSEDDGVVLSVMTYHDHSHSFLIILDAKTFSEKGRVYTPHGIPQGLHGQFFD